MKLPPDIKARWVAALRSGEYEQGTGTMCTPRTAIDDSGHSFQRIADLIEEQL